MKKVIVIVVLLLLAAGVVALVLTGKKGKSVSIGTGAMTGVYYPAGKAIAKVFEKEGGKLGLIMEVESTAGSVFNVDSVVSGSLAFGLVQSDRQYQATRGLAEWKQRGPQKKLCSVCRLHPEVVTLVASQKSGIKTLADLKDKTVNIGNPGSGQRGNALDVLRTAGIDWQKDITAESLKAAEAGSMLQDGRIDAFFYTVGHPSGAIMEATAGRDKVVFVPITGMKKLLEEFPYYSVTEIPVKDYPMAASKENVPSIGVYCTLVTSSDVPEGTVYAVTKALFENLEDFKARHSALKALTKKWMSAKDSAPLHPGAARYFKEAGLRK
jgi:TRAP transporter TAXI family solute receptor